MGCLTELSPDPEPIERIAANGSISLWLYGYLRLPLPAPAEQAYRADSGGERDWFEAVFPKARTLTNDPCAYRLGLAVKAAILLC